MDSSYSLLTLFNLAKTIIARACHQADAFANDLVARYGTIRVIRGLFALLCGVLLVGYFVHEPWRDETQAWLMARDMSFSELWRNAGMEGHPIGWHLLIKPLAMLGLPFESIRFLNIILVLLAAAVVLMKAPFSLWQRAAIVFGIPFLYFGVWARSYSLLLLLSVLLASLYSKRHDHCISYAVVLGLLANTVTLFVPFSGLMGFWWIIECFFSKDGLRARRFLAICVFVVIYFSAIIQLIPPVEVTSFRVSSRFGVFLENLSFQKYIKLFGFLTIPPFFIAPWMYLILKNDRILGFIGLLSMCFFQFVHMFVYRLTDRHFFACFIIMIIVTWIFRERNITCCSKEKCGFNIIYFCFFSLSILSIYDGMRRICVDYYYINSNIQNTVPFVREHLYNTPVAAHRIGETFPLLAYLPGKKFWSPVTRDWGTYGVFDANYLNNFDLSINTAALIILSDCPQPRPCMIFNAPWSNASSANYILIFATKEKSTQEEDFYIYAPKEYENIENFF